MVLRLFRAVGLARDVPLPKAAVREVTLDLSKKPDMGKSNTTKEQFMKMLAAAKEYILAGDIFQVSIA
eukprot:1189266-Prorocentrum_minimum.AAC.2